MEPISSIASALGALKAAKDIGQSMIEARDTAAFQGKMIEFQSKIIDANNAAFAAQEERTALQQQIRDLEKQLAELQAWESEAEKYQLTAVCPGVVAYALKEKAQPAHLACATCWQDRRKMLLQRIPLAVGRAEILVCQQCGGFAYTRGEALAEHAQVLSKLGRRK